LRREDQVDAHGARHLGQSRDRLLDLVARHHHQVRELVDHDHDERQRSRRVALERRVLHLQHLPHVAVELVDVPHAERRQRLVALLHLVHGPPERIRRLLRVHHDRRQEVRDALVHAQLESLRIDHDQSDIVRRGPEEDAGEHRVQPDGFPCAGRACDEEVRHDREVRHVRLAVNGLAER
jgi:hypothetical protein